MMVTMGYTVVDDANLQFHPISHWLFRAVPVARSSFHIVSDEQFCWRQLA